MEWLNNFHFLRPFWFLAIIPLLYLCYLLWHKRLNNTGLENHIDKHLLHHLSLNKETSQSRLPIVALCFIWLVTVIALAGPTWKRIPQPLFSSESAVIILLDLSPSMRANDNKPSRIIRAHLKIQDFLSRRKDGLTALVVYAGEAYIVTPLTDDTKTISNLLPTLKPGILPLPGSNTEMGLSLATELVNEARLTNASILLVTDNIDEEAVPAVKKILPDFISLTIIGVGTEEGSPIPNDGDFLKDKSGNLIVAKRNSNVMESIAKSTNGYYLPMQNDTSDIDFYYKQLEKQFIANTQPDAKQRQYDLWYEFGPTLLVLLIPLIALSFRRGFIISLYCILFGLSSMTPNIAYASNWWSSLWKNDDQKAAEQYKNKDYDNAAKQFTDPQWKGSAHYKNEDYQAALEAFSQDNSAIGDYNRGNSLAQLKRYDEAIKAYDQALEKNKDFKEAKTNKEIIENLKKKEEQQKQNQQKSNNKDSQEQNQQQNQQQKQNADSEQENRQNDQRSNSNKGENQESQNPENNDQKKQKNQASSQEENEKSDQKDNANNDNTDVDSKLSPEEKQALEQWLRKVPDDPSGLLRRKFEYEYQKRRQLYQEGKWELPKNNAHQRY